MKMTMMMMTACQVGQLLCDVDDDMMMIITCRPQGDEYNYEDYSDDNYYDTPDNYDYGDNYGDTYR